MAATGGAAGVHLVHQKRDTIVARRWHPEGTWMSKKIAADHIKLKRAYEPPAPDERTGLCFRESEVKAYDDALKSCGWPPHFVRVRRPVSCYAVCPRLVVVSCRGLSPCFTIVPGWAHSLTPASLGG
jgi:hypothetical protein